MNRFFTLLLAASCLTAVGQSEYCLEGTVWDEELGGCVPTEDCTLLSDMNQDGLVGLSDLLVLLGEFGLAFQDDDQDGVCDTYDDCVGVVDECGVCNGPGPTELVIEEIVLTYDSIFLPLDNDWYVFAISADTIFSYECACGDPVSYQGYDYETVLIGEQCWFAENLRNENYENGDAILASLSDNNLSDGEWFYTTSGAMAVYGEGCSYCEDNTGSAVVDACDELWSLNEYGRLYNWYAVDDARGLCPSGWHVPSDEEWMTMEMALGMSEAEANATSGRGTDQGTQMKTTYGWDNVSNAGMNGTNVSGFSALPSGMRNAEGDFNYTGDYGYWWSSTFEGGGAWIRLLSDAHEDVYRIKEYPTSGFSVRCIRDTD